MLVKQEEVDAVKNALVPTWQSVVAIAYHAKVGRKKTLFILKKVLRDKANYVEMRDCRLDGHNPVWMARPIKRDVAIVAKAETQKYLPLMLEV